MSMVEVLVLLLIASICGSVGQTIAGYSHGGCLVAMVIGFIGALLGTWLARSLSLPEPFPLRIGPEVFPVLWSIIGSTLFVAVVGFLSHGRNK